MKLSWYHSMLVIVAVGVFFTNLPEFIHHLDPTDTRLLPKNWVIAFSVAALPVLLRKGTLEAIIRSPVTFWCFGYLWISLVWFFPSSQDEGAWREVRLRVMAGMELLTMTAVLCSPQAIRLAQRMLASAVLFGVGVNLYELFAPMTFSFVAGRSAGFYINPNQAGQALVLGMILGINGVKLQWRIPFVLLTGAGVLATFSRGSIVAWLLAMGIMLVAQKVRARDLLLALAVSVAVGIFLIVPRLDNWVGTWEQAGTLNHDVKERLEWLSNPFGVSDHSSWSRATAARDAWDKFAERPFSGLGTGASYRAVVEPHNQYLALMVDHGIIGAAILPLLLLSITWWAREKDQVIARVFALSVLTLGFSTHTILVDEHSLILFSLLAAMSWASSINAPYDEAQEVRRSAVMQEEVALRVPVA